MKKTFRKQTLFIENGVMLEEVKDIFSKQGFTTLWGYEAEDYKDDSQVSSGYLHYEDKMFFLSKKPLDKEILTYDFFKWSLQHLSEPKKSYTIEDLKEAMEYGFDYGYHNGFSDASQDDAEFKEQDFKELGIFEEWLNDNN